MIIPSAILLNLCVRHSTNLGALTSVRRPTELQGGRCLRSWRPEQALWPVLSASHTTLSVRVSSRKERLSVLSGPPAFGVLHCVLRKNLLSQLDMESQWFTTCPFFRLTSAEHSVVRRQNTWLPLKAVFTTFCARGECSKNPQQAQGRAGGSGHNSSGGLCCWPGIAWGHLVSPAWGLWCLTGGRYPSSGTQDCGDNTGAIFKCAVNHLLRSPGGEVANFPTPLCYGPTAASTKLAGVYNSGSRKTWSQSHGSGAWLSIGLMPFINNICDFLSRVLFSKPWLPFRFATNVM